MSKISEILNREAKTPEELWRGLADYFAECKKQSSSPDEPCWLDEFIEAHKTPTEGERASS